MLAARWVATVLGFCVLSAACSRDSGSDPALAPPAGHGATPGGSAGLHQGGAAGEPVLLGAGAGGDVAGLAGLAGAAGAHDSDCELVYDTGHGDLFIHDQDGLRVSVRAAFGDGQETLQQPERVCVLVPHASYALAQSLGGVPDRPDFAFLGLPAGSAFWLLPVTPRAGMPWLGASTESLPPARYAEDEVVLSLAVVERPAEGDVALWSTSPIGAPNVLFATSTATWQHAFAVGVHAHFNWGFTRAGDYTIEFRASAARLADGEAGASSAGPAERETSPVARIRFLVKP